MRHGVLIRWCYGLLGLVLAVSSVLAQATTPQTYANPVIAGDFPDPSVIRVGTDYYATATTGGWKPHFTLLQSQDLVNWRIVGAVLTEQPAWAKDDFWAPEITQDKGKFYVFYTARRDEGPDKRGTLCVAVAAADQPAGPYTDKGPLVCQKMGSLDAFFVRDEDNKPFLIWKEDGNDKQQPTWLYAAELDANLTKLKGKPQRLFRNEGTGWENHVVEGADVVRRNGWFYMFYSGNACCGRACNYALGVARSRKLLGPWEKNPRNPILAANEVWQCPGHGTLTETPDGRTFLLYHAYRKRTDAFHIGREALLDEVTWTADGWATINGGRGPSQSAALPLAQRPQQTQTIVSEEFSDASGIFAWQYPMGQQQTFRVDNGLLQIAPVTPANGKNAAQKAELVLAERTVAGTYTAATRVMVKDLQADDTAGLAVYGWRTEAVGISSGAGKIFVWQREAGKQKELGAVALPASAEEVLLRVEATDGETYNFTWATDVKRWRTLGPRVTANIEGARIALLSNSTAARFDWLRINAARR